MADISATAASIITYLLSLINGPSFQCSCLEEIQKLSSSQLSSLQYVDAYGNLMQTLNNSTWGITYDSCQAVCGSNKFPYPFNYPDFANAMTNYLMPWLALTAQLPYEAGGPGSNVLSFFLAVGSPCLITYSLTLTILNRSWVQKKFDDLKATGRRLQNSEIVERISAIQFFLQEGQQVTLRAKQDNGELVSLVVLPQNHDWWQTLAKNLQWTRRSITPSLVAQMSLALIAYFLCLIAASISSLGDPEVANQIASGTLWIWLVPVVLGWVMVGTQSRANSIEKALEGQAWFATNPAVSPEMITAPQTGSVFTPGYKIGPLDTQITEVPPTPEEVADPVRQVQKGLYVKNSPGWNIQDGEAGQWAGLSICGDEERKGPAFNYARTMTWWKLQNTIYDALAAELKSLENPPQDLHLARTRTDSVALARRCDMPINRDASGVETPGAYEAYVNRSQLPPEVKRRFLIASLAAVLVGWGTAGDSIMRAYLTQPVGLGCRSGSYVVYAVIGTVAWWLLIAANVCSHDANVLHQERHGALNYDPTRYQYWLGVQAVVYRCAGHALCVFNGIWLVMTSLMQLVGAFDTCWCQTNYPVTGGHGWIMLFKTSKDLAIAASMPWGVGIAMTIIVIAIVLVFFALGTSKGSKD